MDNKWREVWNNKGINFSTVDLMSEGMDEFAIYSALKKLDGYDVSIQEIEGYYRNFYKASVGMWEKLKKISGISSAYEVGCGSGANLYLLQQRGIVTGGIDYSENLVQIAQKVLGKEDGIAMGEAVNMSVDDRYDVVFSEGVFAYFPDEQYGLSVLEKMYEKATKAIIVIEVFDKSLQCECERHRREMIPDYDEKYTGLGKMFYEKDMFRDFAERHHCRIEFGTVDNPYYWNSSYLFNCYFYKE